MQFKATQNLTGLTEIDFFSLEVVFLYMFEKIFQTGN